MNDIFIEFAYLPQPDITSVERAALAPLLNRREILTVDYYTMGSEGRHLLVGHALTQAVERN